MFGELSTPNEHSKHEFGSIYIWKLSVSQYVHNGN